VGRLLCFVFDIPDFVSVVCSIFARLNEFSLLTNYFKLSPKCPRVFLLERAQCILELYRCLETGRMKFLMIKRTETNF